MTVETVGVFFGGRSVEHEVSVVTAQQVMSAMDASRYRPVPVYVAKSGRWYTGEALRDLERSYVEAALDITRGNLSQAAKLLGIHRTTLYSRMQNYASGMEEGT